METARNARKMDMVQMDTEGEKTLYGRVINRHDQTFVVLLEPDRVRLALEANGQRLSFPVDPDKVTVNTLERVRDLIGDEGEWLEENIIK